MTTIHILNHQTDQIIDFYSNKSKLFWDDEHVRNAETGVETFEYTTLYDNSQHLKGRNRILIPDEDAGFREFIIDEVIKQNELVEVFSTASYLEDLLKAKPIAPFDLEGVTSGSAVSTVVADTGWQPGNVDFAGIRTIRFDKFTSPYQALKTIASTYGLALNFRIETDGNVVTGRYVDLVPLRRVWKGKEIKNKKDLIGVVRNEKTDELVTALICLGPEDEAGNRLEIEVKDEEARERWGRDGEHLWKVYEPQSDDENMTESRLRSLGQTELNKRINTIVSYEANQVSEDVFGLPHEKVRYRDEVRIKDNSYTPSLYLEAQVKEVSRSISDPSRKTYVLGDFIEYEEDDLLALFNSMRSTLAKKVSEQQLLDRTYTKIEIDDKDDTVKTDASTDATNKSYTAKTEAIDEASLDATQKANDAESAAKLHADTEAAAAEQRAKEYAVAKEEYDIKVAELVDDLEGKVGLEYVDGQLIDKANLNDVYSISELDGMFNNVVSVIEYETDQNGVVQTLDSHESRISQTETDISSKVEKTTYDSGVATLQDNIDGIKVGGRNLLLGSNIPITTSSYSVKDYTLTEDLKDGEELTLTIKGELAEGKDYFRAYNSGGSTSFGGNMSTKNPKGLYTTTFLWKANSINEFLRIYHMPSSVVENSTIEWIKLERGNKATDWTPAPEDTQAEIDSVYSYAESEINQLAGEIDLKAEASTVTSLETRTTTAEQNISALEGAIVTKVESSTFNSLEGRVDTAESTISQHTTQINAKAESSTVSAIESRVSSAEVDIDGLNSQITLKAESSTVNDLTSRVSSAELDIDGLNSEIELRVEKDGVIGAINLTSESATIDVEKLNITGDVEIENGELVVKHLSAATGTFSGTIQSPMLIVENPNIEQEGVGGIRLQVSQWIPDINQPYEETGYIEFNTNNNALELIMNDVNGNQIPLEGFRINANRSIFDGEIHAEGNLYARGGGSLKLQSSSLEDTAVSYMEFRNGLKRLGWAGFGNPTNTDFSIRNEVGGDIRFESNVRADQLIKIEGSSSGYGLSRMEFWNAGMGIRWGRIGYLGSSDHILGIQNYMNDDIRIYGNFSVSGSNVCHRGYT
ncbi:phage tail spike protein [Salipaludibacillus sp. CF4.18]|uniref:phage tail spike protein n=1 Tax=Salipaludibacillus sp. CF4.18 TaxID=3373081 RepID=UPI003EE6EB27